MHRSRPLLAGASTMGQVERIFELTGNPTAHDVQSWQSPFANKILENVQAKTRVRLDELCHSLPKDAKRLMKSLFQLDPSKRGTAESALEHDYVADFHDPAKETVYPHGPIKIGIDDSTKLTAKQYREQLYLNIGEKREGPQETATQVGDGPVTSRLQRPKLPAVPSVSYDSLEYQSR